MACRVDAQFMLLQQIAKKKLYYVDLYVIWRERKVSTQMPPVIDSRFRIFASLCISHNSPFSFSHSRIHAFSQSGIENTLICFFAFV